MTNSGTITATATASEDGAVNELYASAFGIYIDEVVEAVEAVEAAPKKHGPYKPRKRDNSN